MALNEKIKNRYRRIIRVVMIVLAVVLLVMGLAVPIANNASAMRIAREMEAFLLPDGAQLIDTTSSSGRFTNKAGSVQYFAALLIESDRPIEELRAHYAQYGTGLTATYLVEPQQGQEITVLDDVKLSFSKEAGGERDCYIVYTLRTGGNAAQWWLDMDVR